jgi:putative transposase
MSQSLSQTWVHIIFSTKKRHPFLKDSVIQQRVHDYIKATCCKQNCTAVIVGGVEDHVHILANLHKTIALSDLVEEIKKSSSKWIKTLHGNGSVLDRFYWQNGYGAFSVSQSSVEAVKFYIKNQHEHHYKQNFQDEFRKFLTQHKMTCNEKYLWD